MPLDPSLVGRTYPPSPPYEVSREKIREFALAVGDHSPLYVDPSAAQAAGYADVIAPPTFAIVVSMGILDQAVNDPELGLDYAQVVHGDQRFVHHRPITAGDRLVGVLRIDNIKAAAGNDMLNTSVVLSTVDGDEVATAFSLLVARGTAAQTAGVRS